MQRSLGFGVKPSLVIEEGTSCSENLFAMVTRNNYPFQMFCFDVVFYVIGLGFFSADLTFENSFSFMISKSFVCFLHHRPYRVVKILENLGEIRRVFVVVFFMLAYLLCILLDFVHRWNGFRIVKLKFMTLE